MARANRHFIPGQVWHLTHRCHKREFLLKFARDRQRWLHWLYQARRRFGLKVLNYCVTSNHTHLLVYDPAGGDTIARSVQLLAGRTGQEYNQRKERKGAFWDDRYHATAIESGDHLLRCITYIDLNMVRAGVVSHPQEWPHGGYGEIQKPRRRFMLIDYSALANLAGYTELSQFQEGHRKWVEAALGKRVGEREAKWTESIAVGRKEFVSSIREVLKGKAQGRCIEKMADGWELREGITSYKADYEARSAVIEGENRRFWDATEQISAV